MTSSPPTPGDLPPQPTGEDAELVAEAREMLRNILDARAEVEGRDTGVSDVERMSHRLATRLAALTAELEGRLTELVTYEVSAYDEGGYGDNRSKSFPVDQEHEAIEYAKSLELRFGATVSRQRRAAPSSVRIFPTLASDHQPSKDETR